MHPSPIVKIVMDNGRTRWALLRSSELFRRPKSTNPAIGLDHPTSESSQSIIACLAGFAFCPFGYTM